MKKLAIAVASLVLLAAAAYFGARSLLPRFTDAVVAGKSPLTAIGTVLKKERIRGPEEQASSMLDGERFFVAYRIDDVHDTAADERDAVLKAEQRRFAKDGPRTMEVGQQEYEALVEGGKITVKYAYYSSFLWGVSSEIRVPW